jgi:DNA-binding MarR family transcriptional regulator
MRVMRKKGAFNLAESLGFLVSGANASMRAGFNRAIGEAGIAATAEQWGVLNIVRSSPGIIQSVLAERSMKDRTNVTRMLDLLEKNGHIERRSDADDRRSYRIYITAAGEELLERLAPIADAVNMKAAKGLTAGERRLLGEFLEKIHHNMSG